MTSCLIIEDNPVNWMIMKNQASKLGFQTQVCDNGVEALRHINEHGMPELILLDGFMPEMDGLTFLEHFSQFSDKAQALVIFCSSSMDKPDVDKALASGAHQHFSKPLQPEHWRWIEQQVRQRDTLSACH